MNIVLYVDLMPDGSQIKGRSHIGATSSDIVAPSSHIVVTSSCNNGHFPVGCCVDLKIVVLDVVFSLNFGLDVDFSLSTWLDIVFSLSTRLDIVFSLSFGLNVEFH